MRRLTTTALATCVTFALLAPAAMATATNDEGQGWWGETTDKVVTNAGFILIVFFPVFVAVMSAIQWKLDKRKDAQEGHQKKLAPRATPRGAAAGSARAPAQPFLSFFHTVPTGAAATMAGIRDPSSLDSGPGAPLRGRRRSWEDSGMSEIVRPRPAAMSPPVRYERIGAAAVVTIDRPERRNAVDGPTAAALGEAYRRFEADDDARVLVLTGAGDAAFCAGADLKAIDTFGPRLGAPEGPLGFTRLTPTKPTIAAISGWCLAGGLELALWCDLRIAAAGATLGFPERRWGVPLIDGGTQRLPRIVGLGRALDIILTGRMVEADEALAIGLLTELVPAGRHLERALEIAEALPPSRR